MPRARPLAGTAALATAALALSPSAAGAAFGDRALQRGDRGHDVRVLQSWLTRLGFRTGVDGSFGSGTERNVERYERRNRLAPDGRVSRGQASRMRRQIDGRHGTGGSRRSQGHRFGERALGRGDRGHDVRVLQSWLTRLGLPTTVDGVFGRATERSVERYERTNGLDPDGEVSREDAARIRRQVERGEDLPAAPEAELVAGHVFPVQGTHRYGDGFGADRGGRSHRGQDVFARCGTPLVAAQGGRVQFAGYHSLAGNYLVVTGSETREDYVYMHLQRAVAVPTGDAVSTGQRIGEVGETGNATGCHLHFELWTEPGWYKGGRAYDPLPALRAWEGG